MLNSVLGVFILVIYCEKKMAQGRVICYDCPVLVAVISFLALFLLVMLRRQQLSEPTRR